MGYIAAAIEIEAVRRFIIRSTLVFLGILGVEGTHTCTGQAVNASDKCTTIIVGRKATVDGSVLLGHNEDWGEFDVPLRWHPRAKHASGDTVSLRGGLVLDQVEETYGFLLPAAICNGINEFQVMITDNSGSCRKEMVPSDKGIEMADLVTLALQRSKSARAAVTLMGRLIDMFGYRCVDGAGGDIFSIADPSEGWWMEVTTAGQWVAQRVPDDAFVVIANRFRIGTVDLGDSSRYLASSNLIRYAIERDWYDLSRGPFDFARAYSGQRAESARREWRGNSLLGGRKISEKEELLAVIPSTKLQPSDLMAFLRDHYEDLHESDGSMDRMGSPHRIAQRPVCTPYTDASTVAQLRAWLPHPIAGLLWFAVGTPCSSVYTPIYVGVSEFPKPYTFITPRYDSENAFWVFNGLENIVDRNYRERGALLGGGTKKGEDQTIHLVSGHWKQIETEEMLLQPSIEQMALELFSTNAPLARRFLANYSKMMALRTFQDAKELTDELRTRHER